MYKRQGIDHSSEMLKIAVEELKDRRDAAVQFVQSQVEHISESVKDSVDTVIFCNAIHYVPNKEELLSEICKTLKPGGKLAFNTSFFVALEALPITSSVAGFITS